MSSGVSRRRTTILVPVYGNTALAERCLRSIARNTPHDVRVLVIDDCGPQRLDPQVIEDFFGEDVDVEVLLNSRNLGFVGTVNRAMSVRGDDDLVIVNSDVVVLSGWFEPLHASAYSGPRVASSTAVADRGGIVSVPAIRGLAEVSPEKLVEARQQVLGVLDRPWAPLPTAVGHVCYLRRDALTDVGSLDSAFSPGYGEEVDWSHRASRRHWSHVAALTSWVLHDDGASFGSRRERLRRRHELLLLRRYPVRTLAMRVRVRAPWLAVRRDLTSIASAMDSIA